MNDQFSRSLYREHLEEASFLYDQRGHLLRHPDFSWLDIADIEGRLETHIDGLFFGSGGALDECGKSIDAGDSGECYAAIRIYCLHDRLDLIRNALDDLDAGDADKVTAFADALKRQWPDHRGMEAMQSLLNVQVFGSMAPIIVGFRRLAAFRELLAHRHCRTGRALPSLYWAAGRLHGTDMTSLIGDSNFHEEDSVEARTMYLLRTGQVGAIDLCVEQAEKGALWPLKCIGISGGRSHVNELKRVFLGDMASADCLLAMGLLGNASMINFMIRQLSVNRYAPMAALALQLITGAGLYEDVFVPHAIDESGNTPMEIEMFRAGESVCFPGEQSGKTLSRLSQKAHDWLKWYKDHAKEFDPVSRYRYGKLFSPFCLLETLRSGKSPADLRQMAGDELVIRYGIDIGWEADQTVDWQRQVLDAAEQYLEKNCAGMKSGGWYFAGSLQGEK